MPRCRRPLPPAPRGALGSPAGDTLCAPRTAGSWWPRNGAILRELRWFSSKGRPVPVWAPCCPGSPRGTPGSGVLSYDRPGYGESRRAPGRRGADAARDAAAVADAFGIERFAVVGRSGGGPHALACAALLPDRVRAAAVRGGLAPPDAAGLEWYAGMTPFNVREHGLARAHLDGSDPGGLERDLAARAAVLRRNPARGGAGPGGGGGPPPPPAGGEAPRRPGVGRHQP
ncbi:alpha/beta fold hydrolase, partial [Streptomyces sp. NPDC057540]|uniref:alpha/beta fold hydrolase n=1 Tax=Streptomyces sp. NPDC057540 TaxID=3346160 RepID=UPI0036ACC01D